MLPALWWDGSLLNWLPHLALLDEESPWTSYMNRNKNYERVDGHFINQRPSTPGEKMGTSRLLLPFETLKITQLQVIFNAGSVEA